MPKLKSPRSILSTHLSRALAYEGVGKLTEARESACELVRALAKFGLMDSHLLSQIGTELQRGGKNGTN